MATKSSKMVKATLEEICKPFFGRLSRTFPRVFLEIEKKESLGNLTVGLLICGPSHNRGNLAFRANLIGGFGRIGDFDGNIDTMTTGIQPGNGIAEIGFAGLNKALAHGLDSGDNLKVACICGICQHQILSVKIGPNFGCATCD